MKGRTADTDDGLYDFLHKALQPVGELRRGQWFVNVLHNFRPKLVNRLIHADVDPFYDDGKLWAAIEFVKENWDLSADGANSCQERVR